MLPPAVVEQQARLGVSAEESKAQRLKRQQARFRDRGGAFVPSTSNPLVDILLARTVSGESPSKAPPKRLSSSKAHRVSPTRRVNVVSVIQESQDVAGGSKSALPVPAKGKVKAVGPDAGTAGTKAAPKRRATAKGKKKTDSETEHPPPVNTKSRSTSKGKGKLRTVPSTSDGNPQPKVKTKSNPAKKVMKTIVSDDEGTLVEVPRKTQPRPKRNIRHKDRDKTDNAPTTKRVIPHADDSITSSTKSIKCDRPEGDTGIGNSENKTLEDGERAMDEQCPRATTKKRRQVRQDEQEAAVVPSIKRRKAANLISAKPNVAIEPQPELRPTKDIRRGGNSKATDKGKGKVKAEPPQDVAELVEDEDMRPLERAPKHRKRKKEGDTCDDRPRKVVKFSDTPVPQSSSQMLKENHELNTPFPKPVTKPPSRANGPPREVLERIRASAARHLRCVDSEPDELDCLS